MNIPWGRELEAQGCSKLEPQERCVPVKLARCYFKHQVYCNQQKRYTIVASSHCGHEVKLICFSFQDLAAEWKV